MRSVGTNFQDYFLKMAPDLSVLDLVEQYYFNHSETFGELLSGVFSYDEPSVGVKELQTVFHRAMFFVKSTGSLSFEGLEVISENDADYTVFPYKDGQIMIGVNDAALLKIVSSTDIELVIGVGF
jgi:hypothetical protein